MDARDTPRGEGDRDGHRRVAGRCTGCTGVVRDLRLFACRGCRDARRSGRHMQGTTSPRTRVVAGQAWSGRKTRFADMTGNDERKISSLRDLPRDIAPPRDLWQGIEAQLAG